MKGFAGAVAGAEQSSCIPPLRSRSRTIALAATLSVLDLSAQPSRAAALSHETAATQPVNTLPQLKNLSPAEANALVGKLQNIQRQLRSGAFVPIELLSGSIASYPMAKVAPRKAFLSLRFDQIFDIEHVGKEDDFRQPYKLTFTPNGLGQLMWFVEVDVDVNGNIERVEMVYKKPPPF